RVAGPVGQLFLGSGVNVAFSGEALHELGMNAAHAFIGGALQPRGMHAAGHVVLLDENDADAHPGGAQSRREAAWSAADDDEIGFRNDRNAVGGGLSAVHLNTPCPVGWNCIVGTPKPEV